MIVGNTNKGEIRIVERNTNKGEKLKKMINYMLIAFFIIYLISIFLYAYTVNKRVILKTDIISKTNLAWYGGSSRSMYDEYYLSGRDYYISLDYNLLPSIRIVMERKRSHINDEVSYYVDKEEIKKYENRKIKGYTSIGITTGTNCPKKTWYYFTLFSYVQKCSNFVFVYFSIFILFAVFLNQKHQLIQFFL